MKENAIGHLVKTNPIKANLSQLKPISNPIKANLRKGQNEYKLNYNKGLQKKGDFEVRINKPNLVRRRRIAKMNVNLYVLKDYENKTAFRPQKNKPNLSRRSLWRSRIQTQFASRNAGRINRRVFYFDSLFGFGYSIGCFVT